MSTPFNSVVYQGSDSDAISLRMSQRGDEGQLTGNAWRQAQQEWPGKDPLNLRNYALLELEGETNIHVWVAELHKALERCDVLDYILDPASAAFTRDPHIVDSINDLMQSTMSPAAFHRLEQAGGLTELSTDPMVFYTTVLDLFQPSLQAALDEFRTAKPVHYPTLKEYLHRIWYLNGRLKELRFPVLERQKVVVILKALEEICTNDGCNLNSISGSCVQCAYHRWYVPTKQKMTVDLELLFIAIAAIHDDETNHPDMVWPRAGEHEEFLHRVLEWMRLNQKKYGRSMPEAWFLQQ